MSSLHAFVSNPYFDLDVTSKLDKCLSFHSILTVMKLITHHENISKAKVLTQHKHTALTIENIKIDGNHKAVSKKNIYEENLHGERGVNSLASLLSMREIQVGGNTPLLQHENFRPSVKDKPLLAWELTQLLKKSGCEAQPRLRISSSNLQMQAEPQQASSTKRSSSSLRLWNQVWIGRSAILGEVVDSGITVRIYKTYGELGIRQEPGDQAYACGQYDKALLQKIINKMRRIARKVAYLSKKALKGQQLQPKLVLIASGGAASGYRLSNGKGVIVLNLKDFHSKRYLDFTAHEMAHAIFASHSQEYKLRSQRVPDAIALHIAELYLQLRDTTKVPKPSKKFTLQKPSLKVDKISGRPAGLVMVTDMLWSGKGGHPWNGIDEFFASAYAGFLQAPKLLRRIVRHYQKIDPKIKPLANKLFSILKVIGQANKLKKLSKTSLFKLTKESQSSLIKELKGITGVPSLDEMIGRHRRVGPNWSLLWLHNPSEMPSGNRSCPSKELKEASPPARSLQRSTIFNASKSREVTQDKLEFTANEPDCLIQRETFSRSHIKVEVSDSTKNKKPPIPATPYYISFINARLPEKPIHSAYLPVSRKNKANRAGLTRVRLKKKIKFSWGHRPTRKDGRVAFFAQSVNIFLRLDPIKIYVSSDYAEDSCPYRVTLKHEQEHALSYCNIFHSYRDQLMKELNSIFLPTESSPLWLSPGDFSKIQVFFEKRIYRIIKNTVTKMKFDMQKDRIARDSPSAYATVYDQCSLNDWLMRGETNRKSDR
jgi:hypothetical protein